MLVDIKERLGDEGIRELLSCAMFPDADQIEESIAQYAKGDDRNILGFEADGDIIGVIGFRRLEDDRVEILHLAVDPDERGLGYGRGLILHMLEREKPKQLVAESDEEAVDFYRNVGFTVESLGEKYPGVERFKCTFNTDFE